MERPPRGLPCGLTVSLAPRTQYVRACLLQIYYRAASHDVGALHEVITTPRSGVISQLPDSKMLRIFPANRGEIRADQRKAPIIEAEIEFAHGKPLGRLFDLALAFAETLSLRVGFASKIERGHALARRQLQVAREHIRRQAPNTSPQAAKRPSAIMASISRSACSQSSWEDSP